MNTYNYAYDNPLRFSDSFGLLSDQEIETVYKDTIKMMTEKGWHREGGAQGLQAMLDNWTGNVGINNYLDCEQQSIEMMMSILDAMVEDGEMSHKPQIIRKENPFPASNHLFLRLTPKDKSRKTIDIDTQAEKCSCEAQ